MIKPQRAQRTQRQRRERGIIPMSTDLILHKFSTFVIPISNFPPGPVKIQLDNNIPNAIMTESIQDTSPRIHSFADSGRRNKKRVSDETCPPNLPVGSMLQSKI